MRVTKTYLNGKFLREVDNMNKFDEEFLREGDKRNRSQTTLQSNELEAIRAINKLIND